MRGESSSGKLDVIVHGHFELLEPEHPDLFVYTRSWEGESLLVVCNFSEREQAYEIPEAYRAAEILIANYAEPAPAGTLRLWEAVVYRRR